MATNVIGRELRYLETDKGNIYFNLWKIDEPIIADNPISISRDVWKPYEIPTSVFVSPTSVTPFSANTENGSIIMTVRGSSGRVEIRNNEGTLNYSGYASYAKDECSVVNPYLFIGTNGVAAFFGFGFSRNVSLTESESISYTPNTPDTFGTYARGDYIGGITSYPDNSDILLAEVVLSNSKLPPSDPFAPGGDSDVGGGNGDFDDSSDPLDFPDEPELSASNSGFVTLFNPTANQLKSLANYMWNNDLFSLDTWKKVFTDPMQAILGLSVVPVNVPSGGSGSVTVGNISTGVSMPKVSKQYVTVDCGSITVNPYWNAYLDYAPFTKISIFLPYIGTHPLDVDDVMGKNIHVKYIIDVLSGSCVAFVKCGNAILYNFIGQAASQIPITSEGFSNALGGAISIAGAIGTMVATGGATAPLASGTIAATAVNSFKPEVEKSGSLSGTGGMLGQQTPYLIISRPRQATPAQQNKFMGYPSFITKQLSELNGYTEIEYIHLDNIPATSSELDEIETILKTGVIL